MTGESDTTHEPEGSDFGRGLPQRLNPAGAHRNVFAYQVPEGRDWRDCFRPDFWRADEVMKQLAAGDRIEIFSPDRSIQFEALILAANVYANPPRLDLAFRPIWPTDLDLPQPTLTGAPRFRVRPQAGLAGCFEIVDRAGKVVAQGISDREAALTTMAAIETNVTGAEATPQPVVPEPRRGDPDQQRRPKVDGRTVVDVSPRGGR